MTSPSPLRCSCGTLIDVSEIPEVESILCPSCGKTVQADPPVSSQRAPSTPPPLPPTLSQKILQTLLDPRSIQWMLMIGGGLSVLGLLIYLVSIGLFDNPIYAATALGLGSIALLASGWGVVIRTRYRTAGQALTFLACVILPLNLWFYDAQGLLLVENNLWLAGLACCTLYVATVYVLRDPMFLYAVEAGITLTVMLFLGHRGWVGHLSAWSVASLVLGVSSLLLETAFPTNEDETFSRKRFGKPLFHSGLVQLFASVSILLLVQCVSWFTPPGYSLLGYDWSAGELVRHPWFAAGLWLVAACAWIFAEWQHRSKGLYTSLGISSLVLAEVTLVAGHLYYEGAIAVMTATALMFHLWLVVQQGTDSKPETDRNIEHRNNSWLGFGLLAIPFSLGFLLQIRSLAPIRLPEHLFYQTANYYVPVMLLLWGTALTAVFSNKHLSKIWSAAYHLLAAATLLLAASEYLHDLGYGIWSIQGIALIPVAILYLPASRIWRGTKHEQSLTVSGHAALVTVVCSVLVAALIRQPQVFLPLAGSRETLLLGILSLEIAAFYFLARLLSRQAVHLYLATGFVAAAIWQYLCYSGIAPTYYAPIFSLLGGILIVSARIRGIHEVTEQIKPDTQRTLCRGPGLTLFQCGNAILLFAIASTILQGLARLLVDRVDYSSLIAVGATILVNLLVVIAAPNLNWRRAYLSTVAWQGIIFALTLNRLSLLNGWQKLEIGTVVVGLILLVLGAIGRLRERADRPNENLSIQLALGSIFSILPIFIAVIHFRWFGPAQSLGDEFALLTITTLMLLLGLTLQLKTPTLCGGSALTLYLGILIVQLAYHPQVAIGVYLTAGGLLLFAAGVVLSIYRDRLLTLPDRIARREGIFRIIDWR